METDVITCPDCGKIIAPKGKIAEARRCKCEDELATTSSKDDTDALGTEANLSGKGKSCYVCGADLTGRVRLKDNLGRYWCKHCASKDKTRQRREEKYKCADCSRPFPKEKLSFFQNDRLCATCFKHREKQMEKKIKKQAAETIHDKHEKRKLLWMGIVVLLILGAAAAIQWVL